MQSTPPAVPTGNELPAARVGDIEAHGSVISTGSLDVFIEGAAAARLNDVVLGPRCSSTIAEASKTVFINGLPSARLSDPLACEGKILLGATHTLIG